MPAIVEARVWRSPVLGSAQFLQGAFTDYSYDPHTHEAACFALITEGAIRIRVRGGELVARKGDIFAIEADGVHAGWPVDEHGWRQRTLYVGHEQLAAALAEDRAAAHATVPAGPLIRDPKLASVFARLHRYSESPGLLLKCEEQYLAFVARLFERHMREAPEPPPAGREEHAVRFARDFLEQNLGEQIRLSDIAAMTGLTPFRLLRSFARSVGMPPHAYLRQARVRFAARLIRRGEALSDAANASGFADQAHMTRVFRRAMGVTPGTYRAAFV